MVPHPIGAPGTLEKRRTEARIHCIHTHTTHTRRHVCLPPSTPNTHTHAHTHMPLAPPPQTRTLQIHALMAMGLAKEKKEKRQINQDAEEDRSVFSFN